MIRSDNPMTNQSRPRRPWTPVQQPASPDFFNLLRTDCESPKMGEKSYFEAYLLAITPIGLFGGLHFYLNRPIIGVPYLCTVGVFRLGYLIDLVRAPLLVKEANMKKLHRKDPTQPLPDQISLVDAYLTWFPLGIFGLHHLYLKRPTWAVIYLATFGLFLAGWLVDAFWMASMVREANHKLTDPSEIARRKEKAERKRRKAAQADDTTVDQEETVSGEEGKEDLASADQVEAISPGGVDTQEQKAPSTHAAPAPGTVPARRPEARAAVALAFSILGLFGAHHYYLKRTGWGILYTVTIGLLGTGWILDWFRIPFLLRRTRSETERMEKTLDDAYVLWFPWGFLGLHQFYLGRRKWWIIYLLSLGVFGIGWLMDGVRLPFLLKAINAARVANQSTEEPEIDTNITPSADDYDDDNNSLALNIPDSSNKYEEVGATTTTGGGDTQRTTATTKDINSPTLNIPDNNTPKADKSVSSPKDAGTQEGPEAAEKLS
ncbi:hypothetical protein RRG08_016144 [Elysia crispata]|uniref:TM2 domain-containing protein n=1 Tax=Elysia crispata TaxID=231223 RepID=A0AAE0Z4K0_9GAST|nr:hypothetical protein RRG08_016144 [Elysia crispata]